MGCSWDFHGGLLEFERDVHWILMGISWDLMGFHGGLFQWDFIEPVSWNFMSFDIMASKIVRSC